MIACFGRFVGGIGKRHFLVAQTGERLHRALALASAGGQKGRHGGRAEIIATNGGQRLGQSLTPRFARLVSRVEQFLFGGVIQRFRQLLRNLLAFVGRAGNGVQVQRSGMVVDGRQGAIRGMLKRQQHLQAALNDLVNRLIGQQGRLHRVVVYGLQAVFGRHQATNANAHHHQEGDPVNDDDEGKALGNAKIVEHGQTSQNIKGPVRCYPSKGVISPCRHDEAGCLIDFRQEFCPAFLSFCALSFLPLRAAFLQTASPAEEPCPHPTLR